MKKKLILSALLVNLLAACGSNPPKAPVTESAPAAPAAAAPATPASTAAAAAAAARTQADASASDEAKARAAAEAEAAAHAAEEARAKAEAGASAELALSKRSVFFPFDVDAVQAADQETILAHGQNLSEHVNLRVRVEGNADERGSSEYNLALGQRRANNTMKALVLSGARPSQIETVSYGEEKPIALGHDEASWAQNRRVDIVYTSGQ
jgi:peptidoglycan-associated lipoprotein